MVVKNVPAGADDDAVFERRVTAPLVPRGAAQRHAVVKRHIVADDRRFADDDAHAMIDEQPLADARTGMDLDAGEEASEVRDEAAAPAQAVRPQPVRQTVRDQCMDSRVTGQHFPESAGCRVPIEYRLDVCA